ncbi:hypothetical protein P3L51_06880 [Streptomyces sp. PSRA5]
MAFRSVPVPIVGVGLVTSGSEDSRMSSHAEGMRDLGKLPDTRGT